MTNELKIIRLLIDIHERLFIVQCGLFMIVGFVIGWVLSGG